MRSWNEINGTMMEMREEDKGDREMMYLNG